ncbi:MAG: hypothetical protein E7301_12830 [Butyrivibrio sp.]|nr:hypothetical protein [Butyrivibrio sp.]
MKEQKYIIKRIMLSIVTLFVLLGFSGALNVHAAWIQQSSTTQTSFVVSIDNTYNKGNYKTTMMSLGISEDYQTAKSLAKQGQIAVNPNTTTYTFSNLKPGTLYYVYAYIQFKNTSRYASNKGIQEYYYNASLKTLPGVVTGLNQEEWYRLALSVNISWDKQTGVDGYEYRFMDHNGNDIDHQTKRINSISEKIKNNRIYTGTVRAYSTINGVTYYSDWCPTAYFMTQPARKGGRYEYRELDAKVSGGKLNVKWDKVAGLDKYEVYVASKRGGSFKKVKTLGANKNSIKISKLGKKKIKSGKTYYVYVRGLKYVGGNVYTTGLNYITQVKKKSVSVIYAYDWK